MDAHRASAVHNESVFVRHFFMLRGATNACRCRVCPCRTRASDTCVYMCVCVHMHMHMCTHACRISLRVLAESSSGGHKFKARSLFLAAGDGGAQRLWQASSQIG